MARSSTGDSPIIATARLRLGEMLQARGAITGPGLARALESQLIYGGRIGTNLVETGCIQLDMLAEFLSVQLGLPAASPQLLDGADRAALSLLPTRVCAKHGLLPLRRVDNTLHLGLIDPAGLIVARRNLPGEFQIAPYIVPELRMLYYLERHFGIQRPKRYLRLPDGGEADRKRRRYLVPTLELPEVSAVERLAALSQGGGLDLGAATGEHTQPSVSGFGRESSRGARFVDAQLAELQRVSTGRAVAQTLVVPLCEEIATSVLFWVRRDFAIACCAEGPLTSRIYDLVIPLKQPSMFEWAVDMGGVVRGPAFEDPIQERVAQFLNFPEPEEACVAPVELDGQVIALLCLHSWSGTPFPDHLVGDMLKLTQAAGEAYRRLRRRLQTGPVKKK